MRKISLMQAATLALALGASNAEAMCGGNLSPTRTPYAVLQPQTAPLPAPVLGAARSARIKAPSPAH